MWVDWAGLLQSGLDVKSVGQAISQWNALDLENAAAERGMIGAMSRTPQEWYAHPQGRALLAQTPMIEIIKIGDSDPELPAAQHVWLQGFSALILTNDVDL